MGRIGVVERQDGPVDEAGEFWIHTMATRVNKVMNLISNTPHTAFLGIDLGGQSRAVHLCCRMIRVRLHLYYTCRE